MLVGAGEAEVGEGRRGQERCQGAEGQRARGGIGHASHRVKAEGRAAIFGSAALLSLCRPPLGKFESTLSKNKARYPLGGWGQKWH